MTVRQIAQEIQRLKPQQRARLLKLLDVSSPMPGKRGGPEDPLSKLIGIAKGVKTGSQNYKEDLYGGDQPL